MRFGLFLSAALVGTALAASSAGSQSVSSVDRAGIRRVIVYGTDPCPRTSGSDIVVCARRPEGDRYRLPERFRKPDKLTGDHESWAYKAEQLEMVGAGGIASCSPVGPGGASGCMTQLIEQARAERRKQAEAERSIP